MKYTPPFRRVDTAKAHKYLDAEGNRVKGATTWLDGGWPKPALINWAANATADGALDAWDELSLMSPAKRLAALKRVRYAVKDEASGRGTQIHKLGEYLITGETVTVPDGLVGYVEGYARLLDAFKVEPVEVEFSVGHYTIGYAGTADLIADVDIPRVGRQRLLIDLKSNKSGIFAETALQLSAYRYSEWILGHPDPDRPMPEVDACAAIHITPTGSHLVPVTADEDVFRAFRYVMAVANFAGSGNDFIGAPVEPAVDSTYRLERVTDPDGYDRALAEITRGQQ